MLTIKTYLLTALILSSKRINSNSNQNSNPVLTDMDVNKSRFDGNVKVVTTFPKVHRLLDFYWRF